MNLAVRSFITNGGRCDDWVKKLILSKNEYLGVILKEFLSTRAFHFVIRNSVLAEPRILYLRVKEKSSGIEIAKPRVFVSFDQRW